MNVQPTVTPFLGFRAQAEEAARYYVSIIPDSRIVQTVKNPADGTVMLVRFELGGLPVAALNTGQDWPFTHAFSFSVACETQGEIDRLWDALTDGGQEVQCGWLTDRFGISWQIVPSKISQWISDSDPSRSARVMEALMGMVKLDIGRLEAAYAG